MKTRILGVVALGIGLMGAAHAGGASDPSAQISAGVVTMAASLNNMALACGHMSAKAVEEARVKQRDAAIKDMKMKPEAFDALYQKTATDFNHKWKSGTDSQRKQSCDQIQKMPKQQ